MAKPPFQNKYIKLPMQTIDLISLIKADKMQVNVKNHMTFALRLFWTVIIAFLILFFINIYHKPHIIINLLITVVVFLPLMWSVISRRSQNKQLRSRYPYAFKSIVESYGLELAQGKELPLVDTYLLSGYDERIFLCMEELHKYQEDHQHPISPFLYKKKYYSKEEYDKRWNIILYFIRIVEGEDVIYTEDQIGMLCEKYKVWSDISKRMLTESWDDIYHDISLDKEYTNQFLELINRKFKDYTKKPDGLRDLYTKESEIDNSLLYSNYVLCLQSAYTQILHYVDMKKGGVDDNEDFNRKNRRMQKVMSSLSIYLMVAVTIGGGLIIWTNTGTFTIGLASAIGISGVCMFLYLLYRKVLEYLLVITFKSNPTIMSSIASMEGIYPDNVLNSTNYLTESDIWKLLLVDGDLFKYPPLIIKPIRNRFVTLLENYPNGVQKALDNMVKEPKYRNLLVSEDANKKEKKNKAIKAQCLLYNLLNVDAFEIVRNIIDSEETIIMLEKTFSSAISADEMEELNIIEKKGLVLTKKWIHIKANSRMEEINQLTEEERYWDGQQNCPIIFPLRFSSVLDCLKKAGVPLETITKLKISGTINSVDIRVLRELSGIGSYLSYPWDYYEGEPLLFGKFDNHLVALDLSEAEVVSDQWYRRIDSYDKHGCWSMGLFGDKEFIDCCHPHELDDWFVGARLKHLVLPQKIKKINSVPTIKNLYAYTGNELLKNEIWNESCLEMPTIRELSQLTYEEHNEILIDADHLIEKDYIDRNGIKWEVKDEVALDEEDKAKFSSAKVVSSDFGKSVCLFPKNGKGTQFIPLSTQGEQLAIGDNVSLDAITIQVIGRTSEKDIMRVKINTNKIEDNNKSEKDGDIHVDDSIKNKETIENDKESTASCSTPTKIFLFFDTETTGVPRNYNAPSSDIQNWPRLVQLAWILTDEKSNIVNTNNLIIRPNGYTIPTDAAKVHGITTEVAMREGIPLGEAIDLFMEDLNTARYIVGHNVDFDKKIVGAEMIRLGMKDIMDSKKSYCTMLSSIDFCKIPGKYGYKYPKLQELYKKLFGSEFDNAHDTLSDIEATEKCFWELKKRELI